MLSVKHYSSPFLDRLCDARGEGEMKGAGGCAEGSGLNSIELGIGDEDRFLHLRPRGGGDGRE